MAGYIGSKASVVSSGAEHKKLFNITTTTTSLTGLVYTPTLVHVFHNGVRLVDGTDYTATNGTSITLTVAAENGDQVAVISYATFQTSDTVSASAGGTFGNNVSVTGTLAATAVTGDGSGLTSLASANLTGALPAISGAALTSLSASALTGNITQNAGPAFSAYSTATQSITTSTSTKVTLDLEDFDTNSNFASSRFTPTVAGYYQINGGCNGGGSAGSMTRSFAKLHKNGTEWKRGNDSSPSGTNGQSVVSSIVYLNGTTDYIELYMWITATGPVIAYGPNVCYLDGALVRAA